MLKKDIRQQRYSRFQSYQTLLFGPAVAIASARIVNLYIPFGFSMANIYFEVIHN
jgi:hypothetical protein